LSPLKRYEDKDVGKGKKIAFFILRYLIIAFGAVCMAISLELFLVPNAIIDGGIAGISIMASKLTGLPLGMFLFLLNLPFLILGYRRLGKLLVLNTLFAVAVMSLTTALLHGVPRFTSDHLLAVLFGGFILGFGVGLVIRYGGSLDGTEIVAILLSHKYRFPVGQVVMIINVFIFAAAGFVFGWDSAMYSVATYYIAYRLIDIVVEGLDESKSVIIVSDYYEEIAKAITEKLNRTATFLLARGAYSKKETQVLYCVVTRLELSRLKSIVQEIDPNAFITIEHVADVMGGSFSRKAAHH